MDPRRTKIDLKATEYLDNLELLQPGNEYDMKDPFMDQEILDDPEKALEELRRMISRGEGVFKRITREKPTEIFHGTHQVHTNSKKSGRTTATRVARKTRSSSALRGDGQ